MSRTVATVWHASLSTLATLLYFLFVLPRWWELTGFSPHAVGTVFRVIVGILIGLTALPVVATLKRARKPEYGTPQLALTLLTGSIVAHLVAGTLIATTALSEIWLSPDSAGMWQFGIYGAAAAIALLGVGAYYLSFVAEMPPPPPKPIEPKQEKQPKQRPWSRKKAAALSESDESDAEDASDDDQGDDEGDDDEGEDAPSDEGDETAAAATEADAEAADEQSQEATPAGSADKLRPSGKRRAKTGE